MDLKKLLAVPTSFAAVGLARFQASAPLASEQGQPARRYVKEVVRIGTYVHRGEKPFAVTRELLTHWVEVFASMKTNGVRVPIPSTHDTSGNPDLNRGWVDELFIDGDSLYMACTLIGSDAIAAAARSDVSLYSPPDFVDGRGVRYARPILHVALCTNPLVPGLGEFVPLAASLARFSTMTPIEVLQAIATALGITEPVTDVNAEQVIVPAVNSLIQQAKGTPAAASAAAAPAPAPVAAAAAVAPVGAVKETVTRYATPLMASHDISPALVKVVADARRQTVAALHKAGKVTAAVAKRLLADYVGEKNEVVTLSLSRGGADDDFDRVVALLADNAPVPLGERTGAQLLELSDGRKAEGGSRLMKAVQANNKTVAAGAAN